MKRHTSGLHYTIVQIGFDSKQQSLPIIVTDEENGRALFEAFYFITRFPYRDMSRTWQREAIKAIARFYDFYRVFVPSRVVETDEFASTLIAKFIESQKYGSSWLPELDEAGLRWNAQSPADLAKTNNYLSKFLEVISEVRDNPLSNASFKSFALSTFRSLEARRRNSDKRSLLYHISKTAKRNDDWNSNGHGPPAHSKDATRAKHFPFERIGELLLEGCRRKRRRSEYTGLASEYNLNLFMSILLCAGAGLRSSEIFHMFVRDVTDQKVKLFHPEHGRVQHHGAYISRQQFLRENFDLLPRTRLAGAQHAGFKSMLMTEKLNSREGSFSVAHFLPEAVHRINFQEWFYAAHREYILNVLPDDPGHPYLFVNSSSTSGFGRPWTKTAMRDAFNSAVRKIGLEPDRTQGVHPHGLRHFYGQTLKVLNVSPLVVQACMHHKTLEAQLAYTAANAAEINRELSSLDKPLREGIPCDLGSTLTNPIGLKFKSDPAGLFSAAKLGLNNDKLY